MSSTCNICFDDVDILEEIQCPSGQHSFCKTCIKDLLIVQTDITNIDFDADKWKSNQGKITCAIDKSCGIFNEHDIIKFIEEPNIIIRYIESVRQFSLISGEEVAESRAKELATKMLEKSECEKLISWIRDNILTSKCPHCATAWYDFDACAALKCSSCGGFFCAICNIGFQNDVISHAHVAYCTGTGDVFISIDNFKAIKSKIIELKVLDVISKINPNIRLQVSLEINTDMIQGNFGSGILYNLIELMTEGIFDIPEEVYNYINIDRIINPNQNVVQAPPIRQRRRLPAIRNEAEQCATCGFNARYIDTRTNNRFCLRHARLHYNVKHINRIPNMILIR